MKGISPKMRLALRTPEAWNDIGPQDVFDSDYEIWRHSLATKSDHLSISTPSVTLIANVISLVFLN
jgi:hypothetical protein